MAQVILKSRTLDYGLVSLDLECNRIYVCSQDPADFAATVSSALGSKTTTTGAVFGAPQAGSGGGRIVTSIPISDGAITASGLATHLAFVDYSSSRLLIVTPLPTPINVYIGERWTLDAITVHLTN